MAIIVSSITRTHSPWRFLFPLQSYSQALSCGITLVVGLFVVTLGLHLVDAAEPSIAILIGSAAGGSATLYGVLPGRMCVRDSSNEAAEIIHHYIVKSRYRNVEAHTNSYRYTAGRWPLLWWTENNVTITVLSQSELSIEGPLIGLLQLKTLLLHRAE